MVLKLTTIRWIKVYREDTRLSHDIQNSELILIVLGNRKKKTTRP